MLFDCMQEIERKLKEKEKADVVFNIFDNSK